MSKMICSKIHVKILKELCWLHYLDKSEGDWSKPGRHVPESWNNQERKLSSFSIDGDTVLLHIRRSGLASTNLHPPGVLWSGATRSDSDDDWPLMLIMMTTGWSASGKYLAICYDIYICICTSSLWRSYRPTKMDSEALQYHHHFHIEPCGVWCYHLLWQILANESLQNCPSNGRAMTCLPVLGVV